MEQSFFTLEIGPKGRIFHVHKEVLTYQSSVCCEALSEEGHEALIKLADVDAEAFEEVVMEWLYTGRLFDATDDVLVKSYTFALRYNFTELRNSIVCELYSKYMWKKRGKLPDYGAVALAFDNLPGDAKLITFLLDLYGKRWNPSVDNEMVYDELQELPKSFLVPLIVRLGCRGSVDADEVDYLSEYLEQADKT
ncbi:hypothetical protein SLS56_005367 [Neofusicoccum ribis]|uniref:BTB domain-containing protein n=1 Tax=Neofusicoccum ribis TaxID=45134 RepID=A0ABR3STX4_9PEZI